MKTIKQLEKEIEGLRDNINNYPYIKKGYKKIDEEDLIISKAKLRTLKEVLKEIDKWWAKYPKVKDEIDDGAKYIWAHEFDELKQKLVGE